MPVYGLCRSLLKLNSAKVHGTDFSDAFILVVFRKVIYK